MARVVRLNGPRSIDVTTIPVPALDPGELRVRTLASGISDRNRAHRLPRHEPDFSPRTGTPTCACSWAAWRHRHTRWSDGGTPRSARSLRSRHLTTPAAGRRQT